MSCEAQFYIVQYGMVKHGAGTHFWVPAKLIIRCNVLRCLVLLGKL